MTQPGTCSPDISPFSNMVKGSTRWTRIRPQVSVSPGAGTCPHRRLIHSHPNIQPPLGPCRNRSPPHPPSPQAALALSIWGLLESSVENLPPCNPGTFQEPRRPTGKFWGQDPGTDPPPPAHPLGGRPLSVPCFLLPSAWSPKEGWAAIENPNPVLPSWPQFQIPKGRNCLAHLAQSAWSMSNNGSPKQKEAKGPDLQHCPRPWCKGSHHGWSPAAPVMDAYRVWQRCTIPPRIQTETRK